MSIKYRILFLSFILIGLSSAFSVNAGSCPTDDGNGTVCSGSALFYCNNTCQTAATMTGFCATNSLTASFPCASLDACGVCNSCSNTDYTLCGAYPTPRTCTPNIVGGVTIPNCSAYSGCQGVSTCQTCATNYKICASRATSVSVSTSPTDLRACVPEQVCAWYQTFDACSNSCVGSMKTLKLGSDSVSNETAGTGVVQSGSQATLYIQGSNVGIGTSTPSTFLQIFGGSGVTLNMSGGRIGGLSSTPINSDEAVPLGYLTSNFAPIGGGASLWATSTFGIYNSGFSNVGIGTSTPAERLTILTANNDIFGLSGGGISSRFIFSTSWNATSSDFLNIRNSANTNLQFTLTRNGYLGIGTTIPTNKLQIGSTVYSNNDFVVGNSNGSVAINNNSDNAYIYSSQRLDLMGNGVNTISLKNGYVGIGTTTPSKLLTIKQLDTSSAIRVIGAAAQIDYADLYVNASGNFNFYTPNAGVFKGDTGFFIRSGSSAYPITIGDNTNNNIILGAGGGRIGIGTTTPTTTLQVYGGSGVTFNMSGGRIGGLSSTPINPDDAVPLGYLTANFVASTTSVKSVYVVSTAASSTGDNKISGAGTSGYGAANNLCNAASTGSHVCSPDEILNTISAGLGSRIPISQIWIFNGPPGFTANAMDCGGRTVSLGGENYGATWYKSATNGEGYGSLAFCNQAYKLACCK